MRINRLTLLALTFIAGLPVAALANGRDHLKAADTNGDGLVDLAEFQALHDQRFADLDGNDDGAITQAEAEAGFAGFHSGHRDTGGHGFFVRADTDKDGRISAAESAAMESRHFQEMDADHDGFVTPDEAKASFAQHMDPAKPRHHGDAHMFFDQADADKDGKVSAAEAAANQQRRFQQMDASGDGYVTQAEAKAAFDRFRAEHPKQPGGADGKPGDRLFARADTDKDGKITKAEWTAGGQQMFARLDKNADGKITADEMTLRRPSEAPAPGQAPTP